MKQRRYGKSLVELIVMMGILSAVLTIAGQTFSFLMRSESRGRASVVEASAMARLANRFRRDVRSANSAKLEVKQDRHRLQLSMPDGRTVEYRPSAGSITVKVEAGGKLKSRERYVIGYGETRFVIDSGKPELVSLVHMPIPKVYRQSSAEAFPRRAIRIEAVRGRELRFAPVSKSTASLIANNPIAAARPKSATERQPEPESKVKPKPKP